MGHATATFLVYGTDISEEEALLIERHLIAMRIAAGGSKPAAHERGLLPSQLGFGPLVMRGHGADCRINTCDWRETDDYSGSYACGFDLGEAPGSDGSDIVQLIAAGPTPEAIAHWATLAPLLAAAGIAREPSMSTVIQFY